MRGYKDARRAIRTHEGKQMQEKNKGKVIFACPIELGSKGDSTHVIQIWKRMPSLLGIKTTLLIRKGKEDSRISGVKNLEIMENPCRALDGDGKSLLSDALYLLWFQFLALKKVLSDKDTVILYARYGAFDFSYPLISKIKGIPLVVEVNGIQESELATKGYGRFALFLTRFFSGFLFRRSSHIIAVTKTIKEVLMEDYKIAAEKITVIHNGADTKIFKPMDKKDCRKRIGLEEDDKVVCFVGNLAPYQGIEYLIESAPLITERIRDAEFLIVGDHENRENLERTVKALGLQERFIFTGAVPYEKVPFFINAADVCVIPKKRAKSGFSPTKLYEYLACERPVVVADTGSYEMEKEEELLIKVKLEKEGIGEAVIEILSDEKKRERLGRMGREIVERDYTWEKSAERTAEIIRPLLKGNRAPRDV